LEAEKNLREVYDCERAQFLKDTTLSAASEVISAVQGLTMNHAPVVTANQHPLYTAAITQFQYFVQVEQLKKGANGTDERQVFEGCVSTN